MSCMAYLKWQNIKLAQIITVSQKFHNFKYTYYADFVRCPNSAFDEVWVHVPNFGGLSGSEDRGGGDNSIQFINFGRVGDKSFKEWRQKIEGGRVGDNNI